MFDIALRAFLAFLDLLTQLVIGRVNIVRSTYKEAVKLRYRLLDLLLQTGKNILRLFKSKALYSVSLWTREFRNDSRTSCFSMYSLFSSSPVSLSSRLIRSVCCWSSR